MSLNNGNYARVSVIIPCFNGEEFIDRSISSVFEQNYQNIELIVVDDGSSDKSKDRILSWEMRFSSKGWILRYIYQENCGLGGAIDTGLKYVTGDYLTLLDADDRFLPDSIKKRATFLDTHSNYAGVRSNGWKVSGNDRSLFVTDEKEKEIEDLFTALTTGTTNNWAGTYMVRTDVLFSIYQDRCIYPSRAGQNLQLLLPVAYKNLFGFIDEPLMEYIIQQNSLSQTCSQENQFELWERNAQGWRDIYINTVNRFITNDDEMKSCIRKYDSAFLHTALYRSIEFKKTEHMGMYYEKLKKSGLLTLDDRIEYFMAINSPFAFPLRVLRKAKRAFRVK